jgi:hypothetical protein
VRTSKEDRLINHSSIPIASLPPSPSTRQGTALPATHCAEAPSPLPGTKGVSSRAKGTSATPPPAVAANRAKPIKRPVPHADTSDTALAIRTRYERALADVAGAVGLYLHGAATLANPSMGDVDNVCEVAHTIRQFALPSVGFNVND